MNDKKSIQGNAQYELVREIAQGGMGTVYEARQSGVQHFHKTVAIKTISEEYATNKDFTDMFIGEAKLVADLIHENIVQVYQLGEYDNGLYIAMEYIDGHNLGDFIDSHILMGQFPPVEIAAFIISRICRALEYAHNKRGHDKQSLNVVHRDVSPKNVMITTEGVVKLGDFGIAKARNLLKSQEGEVLMGKAQYMSPEQANFKETDRRSDIFSLGVVFYELLTHHPLFEGENSETTLARVISEKIPSSRKINRSIPQELEDILNKALERKLSKRYQSAGEMGYDLEYYMYHDRYGPTNVTLAKYLANLFGSP